MLAINFGRGTRASYGPGTPNEDVIVPIPGTGSLPPIAEGHSAGWDRFKGSAPRRAEQGLIVVGAPLDEWDRADEVRIYWVDERQEWVAFHFHEWVEDVWGTDISADGPYALAGNWYKKICEAFGLDPEKLDPNEIVQSPMERLEQLREEKGG